MTSTLNPTAPGAAAGIGDRAYPSPHWNPYLVGFLLGIVLLATYAVTGRGLGATGAYSAVAAWIAGVFSPDQAVTNIVHAKYWNDGSPLLSWTVFLLVGVFIGALLSGLQRRRVHLTIERGPRMGDGGRLLLAFAGGAICAIGAKIAKGCTSGQALTGGAILNVGSLLFMLSVFAAAYGLAYVMRKEWL